MQHPQILFIYTVTAATSRELLQLFFMFCFLSQVGHDCLNLALEVLPGRKPQFQANQISMFMPFLLKEK
jgi:hypothetical protein